MDNYPPHSYIAELKGVTYPCIAKPLASINGSKKDIAICTSPDELKGHLVHCSCKSLQVQEYIDKDIEFQLIGCSLNKGEKVIIPGASIILRQPKNTNTGFLKYIPARYFTFDKESCERFIRNTGYSGLFSLEFIRDKNGNNFFMEINFRNDGNAICVTASGMNLPLIWFLYCSGLSWEQELHYEAMKEVYVMPEFNDIGNAIRGHIGWREWLKDVKRTDRFMEFSKYDQRPFWAYCGKKIKHLICK